VTENDVAIVPESKFWLRRIGFGIGMAYGRQMGIGGILSLTVSPWQAGLILREGEVAYFGQYARFIGN